MVTATILYPENTAKIGRKNATQYLLGGSARMAFVPKDAEWFLADLVQEIRVAGSKRNIVHINYVIIHAASPEAAFATATALGKRSAISYTNEMGKKVMIRFRGLRNLDVIYDPLE